MVTERREFHQEHIRAIHVPEKDLFLRIATARTEAEMKIRKNLMEHMQMPGCKFKIKEVNVGGSWVIIEENQLIIHDEPKTRSIGSQAKYIAESEFRSPGLLVQTLEDGEISSDHLHKFRSETFHLLAGSASVKVQDEKVPLTIGNPLNVEPLTYHQISGEADGAIVLLVIRGAQDCLDKIDYVYRNGNNSHLPQS